MLINTSLREFAAQTASPSPAPGGGSVSALAGAMGVALAEMVINLTVGKKKYADVAGELAAFLPQLGELRDKLLAAVDRDTEAFNRVMRTFAMTKETTEQALARSAAIQEATIGATEIPLAVMKDSLVALEMTLKVAQQGNRNSASDAGVAGLLLAAAVDGAALNVKINLAGLPDDLPFKGEVKRQMEIILASKNRLAKDVQEAVAKNLASG